MKTLKKLFMFLWIIPCIFLLNGCAFLENEEVHITHISVLTVEEDETTYVVHYSDGTMETVPVETVNGKTVVDIKKTSKVGSTSTYTIYYSDNSTTIITIEDGKDGSNGEDGNDVTIDDIYERYLVDHPNATYDDFLKEYLTIIQKPSTVEDATNIALQSAVTIWCEFPTSTYLGTNKDTSLACGSGVIYKMEETYSYIITNYHVVFMPDSDTESGIASKITIFQYGTSEFAYQVTDDNGNYVYDDYGYPTIDYGDGAIEADYVGGELTYDLALIKVPTEELIKYNPHAVAVNVANDYSIGETAIAIGNPECEGFSVTSGIISVESEDIVMTGADERTECKFRVMRIDTAVNGGNSGGGLFNINGEWIGIVNAKAVASEIDNIAYAIPYDNVTAIVDNLLHYYDGTNPANIKKLYLGISYTTENGRAVYNPTTNKTELTNDLVIAEVTKNSVGHTMGFEAGDVVKTISINGNIHTIKQAHQLPDLLLTVRAGDKIIIEVKRDGESELVKCGLTDENGVLQSYLKTVSQIS